MKSNKKMSCYRSVCYANDSSHYEANSIPFIIIIIIIITLLLLFFFNSLEIKNKQERNWRTFWQRLFHQTHFQLLLFFQLSIKSITEPNHLNSFEPYRKSTILSGIFLQPSRSPMRALWISRYSNIKTLIKPMQFNI